MPFVPIFLSAFASFLLVACAVRCQTLHENSSIPAVKVMASTLLIQMGAQADRRAEGFAPSGMDLKVVSFTLTMAESPLLQGPMLANWNFNLSSLLLFQSSSLCHLLPLDPQMYFDLPYNWPNHANFCIYLCIYLYFVSIFLT